MSDPLTPFKAIGGLLGGGNKKSKKQVSAGGYQQVKHTAPAQRGLISIYGEAAPLLGDIQRGEQSASRTSDIADVMRLGPDAIAAYKKAHPEVADLLDTLYAQAKAGLLAGGKLTGDQIYQATNPVKAGFAARGINNSLPQGLAESLQLFAGGNALQNQRQDRAASVAGQIAQTYGDPYQRVLGSSGAGSVAQAQSSVMQALGLGGGAGNYLGGMNPESAYAADLNNTNFNALVGSAISNAQSKNALIGAGINALGSAAGGMLGGMCWVARAVYGVDNPKWLQFRDWLYGQSPDWFFRLYWRHGEKFAAWIADKPRLKVMIRVWMDGRIANTQHQTPKGVAYGAK